MKKALIEVVLLVGLLGFIGSCNQKKVNEDSKEIAEEENSNTFKNSDVRSDAEFAVDAADAGLLQMQLGQLAQVQGQSQVVRDLGKLMADERTRANDELAALALRKNISLPLTLSDVCRRKFDDLSVLRGLDFDDAYTSLMVEDHEEDLQEFQKEADHGDDAELRDWAAKQIPVMQHSLAASRAAEKIVDESTKRTGAN